MSLRSFFSLPLSSSPLSLCYYTAICRLPIPLTRFLYSLSLRFVLFISASLPFSDVPPEDQKTDKIQCMWWIYPLHDRNHLQPGAHRSRVSTTSEMHMLIQLHNCSFKVSLIRYMILLWSPVWWYDSLRGSLYREEGWLLRQRTERKRRWQIITFESFLGWRMEGQRRMDWAGRGRKGEIM